MNFKKLKTCSNFRYQTVFSSTVPFKGWSKHFKETLHNYTKSIILDMVNSSALLPPAPVLILIIVHQRTESDATLYPRSL
jgi:hypothetical protein